MLFMGCYDALASTRSGSFSPGELEKKMNEKHKNSQRKLQVSLQREGKLNPTYVTPETYDIVMSQSDNVSHKQLLKTYSDITMPKRGKKKKSFMNKSKSFSNSPDWSYDENNPFRTLKYVRKTPKPNNNKPPPFSCMATKDLWYNKLNQVINDQREREPETTTIQVTYYDSNAKADICKTLNVGSTTTTRECISLMLDHLGARDPNKFQLWIKTPDDDSPYPLIGHEYPFAIKYNCMRENMVADCESNQCNGQLADDKLRCNFILRHKHETYNSVPQQKKMSKKTRKSPIKLHNVFKRSNSKGDITDGSTSPSGALFGHHLSRICLGDGTLPPIIMSMLYQLFQKGPFTVGIFRKSANARLVRELKEKIDAGEDIPQIDSIHITAIAALFKDFLRSLPNCLLDCELYDQWLSIPHIKSPQDRISHTLLLCSRLPRVNLLLLQHFLCILHHISRRSSENMMPASNLAVCVGQSLLWPCSPILALSTEASKQAPATVEFLIERCSNIFGRDILKLLGDPPETDPLRQDSGAEESDSLHSGHSLHSSGGMRRDDSSIDSLEREYDNHSVLPRKDKMSLTNLSRDSGLTMSDSQLYTPDEEESGSTSSSHSGGHRDKFQHYTAPNNPNAIYTAVFRRPEKVQIDEPDYYASPHTKVHVTYSSPDFNSSKGYYNGIQYDDSQEVIYSVPNVQGGSNFQRHDWTRRKSNIRKVTKTVDPVRSNSEESLFNKYNSHLPLGPGTSHDDTVFNGNYSGNLSDDTIKIDRNSPLRRSKSAHQIDPHKALTLPSDDLSFPTSIEVGRWHRSQSTPQIHDDDRSYDSSTLSDDDSTPHVSRSNSRGKEYGNDILHPWNDSYEDSRNSSFKSERTGSMCTVVSAGSTNTLSSSLPSYEEALNRRTMIKSHQNDHSIREEKVKSARAKQLYEESLRIYREENTYPCDLVRASPAHTHDSDDSERPPPLPPKSDPPPLPPKQKTSRKGDTRLKHLPPVHVDNIKKKVSQNSHAPYHKTIIYTDTPHIPAKERTVIEIDQSYSAGRSSNFQSVLIPEKKSIETQTDDYDLDDGCDDVQTSWNTELHVTSVPVPDTTRSRRKSRQRQKETFRETSRSHSMPGRNIESDEDVDDGTCNQKGAKRIDPDFEQEISWSVSRLRAIFGDALNGAKVHPPPYRPPPSAHRNHSTYIDNFPAHKSQSNYTEESYV